MLCSSAKTALFDRRLTLRSRASGQETDVRPGSKRIFICVFGVMLGKKSPLIDIYQFFCIIVSYFESCENTYKGSLVVDCKGCYGSY